MEMERHMQMVLDQNRIAISNSLRETAEGITPYDLHDMRNVLEFQKKMMKDVLDKNVLLVTENSQLHVMHLLLIVCLSNIGIMSVIFNRQTTMHIGANVTHLASLFLIRSKKEQRFNWKMHQWLPWRGTAYAVAQYPAVPDFVFAASDKKL
jgi:hypothetical protein